MGKLEVRIFIRMKMYMNKDGSLRDLSGRNNVHFLRGLKVDCQYSLHTFLSQTIKEKNLFDFLALHIKTVSEEYNLDYQPGS